MDDPTRLVFQVYDGYGALATTCDLPGTDCHRAGILGFSAGATATLMAIQTDLSAIADFTVLGPAPPGQFKTAVAYYPGCGLSNLVSLSSPDAYDPIAPVQVWHASLDPLLENCPTRQDQAGTAANERGESKNPFSLFVYEGAGHGFDSGPVNDIETAAQQDARPKTQAIFSSILSPLAQPLRPG
jgi:dienelactone hydrolase